MQPQTQSMPTDFRQNIKYSGEQGMKHIMDPYSRPYILPTGRGFPFSFPVLHSQRQDEFFNRKESHAGLAFP